MQLSDQTRRCLSENEIKANLQQVALDRNFPELLHYWQKFEQAGVPLDKIDLAKLEEDFQSQCSPFGSRGRLVLFGIAALSAASTNAYLNWLEDSGISIEALSTSNKVMTYAGIYPLALLCNYVAGLFLTRGLSYQKIAGLELASMLREPNFRQTVDCSEDGLSTMTKLKDLGITATFDDPKYKKAYGMNGKVIEQAEIFATHAEYALSVFRENIGHFDVVNRTFSPGRYFTSFIGGKNAISKFLKSNKLLLDKLKDATATKEDSARLMLELANSFAKDSAGYKQMMLAYQNIQNDNYNNRNLVVVKVWDRDPLVDLSNEKEFFSSASLRVDKTQLLTTKGKLGVFSMLRTKCMSCLDFSKNGIRFNRARVAAATTQQDGKEFSVLYVDGVEGSRELKPAIIIQAIIDYAKKSGFDYLFFNKHPLNVTPKRLVANLSSTETSLVELNLEFISSSRKQYLDAFCTVQEAPFEYSCPKGKVTGHLISLKEELTTNQFREPGLRDKFTQLIRQNFSAVVVPTVAALSLTSLAFGVGEPSLALAALLFPLAAYWQLRKVRPS